MSHTLPVDYVNVHGQSLNVDSMARMKVKRASCDTRKFLGFRAVGYSTRHVSEGRVKHEIKSAELIADGKAPLASFDLTSWMRLTKPKAIRSKPYEIASAADAACRLAEKDGWIGCRVVEVFRGKDSK